MTHAKRLWSIWQALLSAFAWAFTADNRGGVTSLLRTHFFQQIGQFSMVFTISDVCGASPNQQALRTFCLLRASFPPPSF